MSEWFDVKNKLPKPGTTVLVCTDANMIVIKKFCKNKFSEMTDKITHWMPLPTSPITMNDEYEKPPIGLTPMAIHNQHRALEIIAAINRYVQANKPIPKEWFDELLTKVKTQ